MSGIPTQEEIFVLTIAAFYLLATQVRFILLFFFFILMYFFYVLKCFFFSLHFVQNISRIFFHILFHGNYSSLNKTVYFRYWHLRIYTKNVWKCNVEVKVLRLVLGPFTLVGYVREEDVHIHTNNNIPHINMNVKVVH